MRASEADLLAVLEYLADCSRHRAQGSSLGAQQEAALATLHKHNYDVHMALAEQRGVNDAAKIRRQEKQDAQLARTLQLRLAGHGVAQHYGRSPSKPAVKQSASNPQVQTQRGKGTPNKNQLRGLETRLNRHKRAYSGPLTEGDVMYMQSNESSVPYIAVIKCCEGSHLICRWFYRQYELPPKLRTSRPLHEHEVFLSTHEDKNSRESVLGLCHVAVLSEHQEPCPHERVCRYAYNIEQAAFVPVGMNEWNPAAPSDHASSSPGPLSADDSRNLKRGSSSMV